MANKRAAREVFCVFVAAAMSVVTISPNVLAATVASGSVDESYLQEVGQRKWTIAIYWASWSIGGLATGMSVFVCPSIGIFEVYWSSYSRAYDSVGLDFVNDSCWDSVLTEYFWTNKQYGNPPA